MSSRGRLSLSLGKAVNGAMASFHSLQDSTSKGQHRTAYVTHGLCCKANDVHGTQEPMPSCTMTTAVEVVLTVTSNTVRACVLAEIEDITSHSLCVKQVLRVRGAVAWGLVYRQLQRTQLLQLPH